MPESLGSNQVLSHEITEATFTDIPLSNFIEIHGGNTVMMLAGQVR